MASICQGVAPEVHVPTAWRSYDFAGHAEGSSNGVPHQSLFVLSYLRIFGTFPHIAFSFFFPELPRTSSEFPGPKEGFFHVYACI